MKLTYEIRRDLRRFSFEKERENLRDNQPTAFFLSLSVDFSKQTAPVKTDNLRA